MQKAARTARRPKGRSLLDWEGEYEDRLWRGPDTVRLHVVTTGYSVLREWDPVAELFQGWYVNLELPGRLASRDLIMDLVFSDDLLTWSYKDRHEFDWARAAGRLSAQQAATALQRRLDSVATGPGMEGPGAAG